MLKKTFLSMLFLMVNLFASDIEVKHAYVRAVPPNLKNSASFMKIYNHTNKDIFLLSASCSASNVAELHEHVVLTNGMMKMQQVNKIKIPANSFTELKPGGYHVMLLGINKALKEGDIVKSLTLYFSTSKSIILKDIPVKSVLSGMKKHMKMN